MKPIFAFSICLLQATFAMGAEPRRPNILWLVGENIGHDLGCYGAKHVHTPNLDRLARDGMRFTNVFSTNPACAPSRSAFMLGMYQTTTDTHHMRSHRDDDFRLPAGVRPVTHRLQDAGYFTANVKQIGTAIVGTGKLDLNFINEGSIYQGDDWSELKNRQPFFAQINSPEVEYDIYDRKTYEKERVLWVGEGEHIVYAKPDEVEPPPYFPNHSTSREEWSRYLNSVSGMDVRIGRVLEQLKIEGLDDDTIVIFFADNGRLEPRGIHWCYDSGLRVPMIIRWPKNFQAPTGFESGRTSDAMISLIDLTATTLKFAGINHPVGMQGQSFLGNNLSPPREFVFAARDRIDETYQRIRSVHHYRFHYIRTISAGPTFSSLNRYKEKCFAVMPVMREMHAKGLLAGAAKDLMERSGPCEELYDLQADPWEINDLSKSSESEHQAMLMSMRSALDQWIIDTGDRGEIVEPPEIAKTIEREMETWFGTPSWAK